MRHSSSKSIEYLSLFLYIFVSAVPSFICKLVPTVRVFLTCSFYYAQFYRRPEDYLHHLASHCNLSSSSQPLSGALYGSPSGPSIITNYGLNFSQSYGDNPTKFDIVNDYWHPETEENFNYGSCYDYWWMSSGHPVDEQRPVNSNHPLANRSPQLNTLTNNCKSPRLTIPPINKTIENPG